MKLLLLVSSRFLKLTVHWNQYSDPTLRRETSGILLWARNFGRSKPMALVVCSVEAFKIAI